MSNTPFNQADDLPPPNWFEVDIGDEVMESKDLSLETCGALYRLSLDYFYKGGLPTDDRLVQKIAGVPARKWMAVRRELMTIFGPDWRHHRWDRIITSSNDRRRKQRQASKLGVEARRRPGVAPVVNLNERRAAQAASATAYKSADEEIPF
jgi:uncharacterized protein YdaU (DUF1376 family)